MKTTLRARDLVVFILIFSWHKPESCSIPLRSLYSYGTTAGDGTLARQDDGYSPLIILSQAFPFYGMSSNLLFVSAIILIILILVLCNFVVSARSIQMVL